MNEKLTIQIVGWNSAKDLRESLGALSKIPRDEVYIRFLDNGSKDESVKQVKRLLPHAEVIELGKNIGYGAAHNVGFRMCDTELILVLNPDVLLSWVGIKSVLAVFKSPDVGAAQGKLLRNEGKVIDSAGITHTLSLNGHERGANEVDGGQFDEKATLLAVTGACAIFRLSALRDVVERGGQYFDEDFFAYKEDVDLGWRLNRKGWRVLYAPVITGRHKRALGARGWFNWGLNPIKITKRLRSERTKYSFRNWIWMITKNASLKKILLHELFIDGRLLVFILLTILYWPFTMTWIETIKGMKRMIDKRAV